MAWTIKYSETSKKQLRKLDKIAARRIVDFIDERIATTQDPRAMGKALKGAFGATAWVTTAFFATFRTRC